MKLVRTIVIWIVCVLLTYTIAHYQRSTGPTYPLNGSAEIGGTKFHYTLKRTQGGLSDHRVEIPLSDPEVTGYVLWKRYKLDEPFHKIPLERHDDLLTADLPHQPPAGKLEYQIFLVNGEEQISLPKDETVVIRFKGDVPLGVLIPHIFAMFFAILFAVRALAGVLTGGKYFTYAWLAFVILCIGGFILGPIVQKYAFGAYWTGWPFGEDLTDNKTAVAILFWLIALWRLKGNEQKTGKRILVILAIVVQLGIYLIPHSMNGSEIDYSELPPDSLIIYDGSTALPDSLPVEQPRE